MNDLTKLDEPLEANPRRRRRRVSGMGGTSDLIAYGVAGTILLSGLVLMIIRR
jgi:hypothetical protein